MPPKRTCFLISPITEPASARRQATDDLLRLVIEPAIEELGFEILRADSIAESTSINEPIVRLVQEADLCIVDLTGHNSNVLYECGRRHEAGRPCIQLIEASERSPFNLAAIRTIKYQLGDERSIRDAVRATRSSVAEIEGAGFSGPPQARISGIAEALTRIEGHLERLVVAQQSPTTDRDPRPLSLMENPLRAMQDAIIQDDLPKLVSLLPRLEDALGPLKDPVIQTAVVVAISGNPAGAGTLRRTLTAGAMELGPHAVAAAVSGFVQYCVARSEEKEGCEFLTPILGAVFDKRADLNESQRAFLHNQLSILQHGARDYDAAMDSLREALELEPTDRSYLFNISVLYERRGQLEDAVEAAGKSISDAETPDVDHLAHAIELFGKVGKADDARLALETLQRLDPARARFVEERVS